MTSNNFDLRKLIPEIASQKMTLDKEFFENLIQPTWNGFKIIHEDYKSTFDRFSALLQKSEFDDSALDSLFKTKKEYWTFSSELKNELEELTKTLSLSETTLRERLLLDFIKALDTYFEIGKLHGEDMLLLKNLQIQLKYPSFSIRPSKVSPEQLAKTIINDSMSVISSRYPAVESTFISLRTELLS